MTKNRVGWVLSGINLRFTHLHEVKYILRGETVYIMLHPRRIRISLYTCVCICMCEVEVVCISETDFLKCVRMCVVKRVVEYTHYICYTYVCVYTYVYVYVHVTSCHKISIAEVLKEVPTCISYSYIHTSIYIYIYIYMHTCIFIYTYIYINI